MSNAKYRTLIKSGNTELAIGLMLGQGFSAREVTSFVIKTLNIKQIMSPILFRGLPVDDNDHYIFNLGDCGNFKCRTHSVYNHSTKNYKIKFSLYGEFNPTVFDEINWIEIYSSTSSREFRIKGLNKLNSLLSKYINITYRDIIVEQWKIKNTTKT